MTMSSRRLSVVLAGLASLALTACGASDAQVAALAEASASVNDAMAAVASAEAEADEARAEADDARAELEAEVERAAEADAREAAAAASEEGRYELTTSCDYILDFDNGHRFVGDAFLTYLGTTPITVVVTAQWMQSGGEPIVETQEVSLAEGDEDVQVPFSVEATSGEVDAIQALPRGNQCSVDTDGTESP
ncbi:hypothetical protein [Jannaschia sp. R86511]|uniref:hypothetical protein n=1 Tax=Jannaschia sp. R86511 TaxID=3093853 RepID=UPI0036D43E24